MDRLTKQYVPVYLIPIPQKITVINLISFALVCGKYYITQVITLWINVS